MLTSAELRTLGHRFNVPSPTVTGWIQNGVPSTTRKLLEHIVALEAQVASQQLLLEEQRVTIKTLARLTGS